MSRGKALQCGKGRRLFRRGHLVTAPVALCFMRCEARGDGTQILDPIDIIRLSEGSFFRRTGMALLQAIAKMMALHERLLRKSTGSVPTAGLAAASRSGFQAARASALHLS